VSHAFANLLLVHCVACQNFGLCTHDGAFGDCFSSPFDLVDL